MTSISRKFEVEKQNTDLECSSFFVFHSSKFKEEQLSVRPSCLQMQNGLSPFEEIEARFFSDSSIFYEDKESQDTESNPDASAMTMDAENGPRWAYYPNSMQVMKISKMTICNGRR
jgi:hypothetical protein